MAERVRFINSGILEYSLTTLDSHHAAVCVGKHNLDGARVTVDVQAEQSKQPCSNDARRCPRVHRTGRRLLPPLLDDEDSASERGRSHPDIWRRAAEGQIREVAGPVDDLLRNLGPKGRVRNFATTISV